MCRSPRVPSDAAPDRTTAMPRGPYVRARDWEEIVDRHVPAAADAAVRRKFERAVVERQVPVRRNDEDRVRRQAHSVGDLVDRHRCGARGCRRACSRAWDRDAGSRRTPCPHPRGRSRGPGERLETSGGRPIPTTVRGPFAELSGMTKGVDSAGRPRPRDRAGGFLAAAPQGRRSLLPGSEFLRHGAVLTSPPRSTLADLPGLFGPKPACMVHFLLSRSPRPD